nr:uncharacterized protein LOC104110628 isoform X1 [Nicotiana tomentosiformis]
MAEVLKVVEEVTAESKKLTTKLLSLNEDESLVQRELLNPLKFSLKAVAFFFAMNYFLVFALTSNKTLQCPVFYVTVVSGLVQISGTFVCCYLAFMKIKYVKEVEMKDQVESLSALRDEIKAEMIKVSGLKQKLDADTLEILEEHLHIMDERVKERPICAFSANYIQFLIVYLTFNSLVACCVIFWCLPHDFCVK